MIRYSIPSQVKLIEQAERPLLTTQQGGKVAVDPILVRLWQLADQHTLSEILYSFREEYASPSTIRCGLACLVEAGLLDRDQSEENLRAPAVTQGARVAVVIVSYNSRDWLEVCIPSLLAQTYHKLQIIVVDNGSQDDTAAWMESNYPQFTFLRIAAPQSLAHAMNQGAALAEDAGYILMLNPDIELEPDAIAELVAAAEAEPNCAAVGAKLRFWWARSFLNGIGNRVGPFSWGSDNALGHLDMGQYDGWQELPSACFAAALISKAAWDSVGPVDEGFPMYYEDTEWCYRARLLGYKILSAPQAVVYHAFGGKVPSGEAQPLTPRKLRNVVYGRLRFAFKIPGEHFPRYLRNYLLEDWMNFTQLLVRRDWNSARAYLGGWGDILRQLSSILKLSRELQAKRVVSDDEIAVVQANMPMTYSWNGLPELTWDLVVHYYAPLITSERTKLMPEFDPTQRNPHLLIVSNDVVDEKMAGPGMRYLEMARALSGDDLDITLAIPNETSLSVPGLNLVRYWEQRPDSLRVLVENSDIALISGYMVEKFTFLHTTRTRLVVDLYDPTILENLHYYLNEPLDMQQALNQHGVNITNLISRLGDYFICGNERQRDFWLGLLAANGRINPRSFSADPSLRALIDVVGIGFPDRPLQASQPFIRGVHPNIPEDAQIVLWGGGIWNWLDPLTLIQAWPEVIHQFPKARLVFLGTRHPNPLVPVHEMATKAQNLAEEIGEKDRSIIFIEWVSYQERELLLNEANIGASLHPIHVETRYSIRTRVLDYLWARLPVLVTDGDITSEWVNQYQLGEVVPPFAPQAVSEALIRLLEKQKFEWGPAFEPLIERFRWPQVVAPLKAYCLQGGYAPDRQERGAAPPPAGPAPAPYSPWGRAVYIWRTEGVKALFHRGWRYIQWRLSRP